MVARVKYVSVEDRQWYVGHKFVEDLNITNVVSVQADGHELEHILSNSTGLPVAKDYIKDGNTRMKRRVQTWYGDHAKFIVGNLL